MHPGARPGRAAPADRRCIEDQGIARDGARWLRRVSDRTVAAIEERGTATATELTKVVPELREKLVMGEGKTWGGTVGMSTRVLFLLATEGRIVRGPAARPVAVEPVRVGVAAHLGGPAARRSRPPTRASRSSPGGSARYGPRRSATSPGGRAGPRRTAAPRWARSTRSRSSSTTASATCCPTTSRRSAPPRRWVALAPRTRPDDHGLEGARLVPRPARGAASSTATGTPGRPCGPTVGSSAAGVNARDGVVEAELLEPVDATAARAVEREAAALTEWLAGTVVTPRFRTPLEKEIAAR